MKLGRTIQILSVAAITAGVAGAAGLIGSAGAAGFAAPPTPTGVVTQPPPVPDETATTASGPYGVHVTWSDGDGQAVLQPGSAALVTWTRTGTPPKGAVGPAASTVTSPSDTCGDGWHCNYPWTLLQGKYVPNGTYAIAASAKACTGAVCSGSGTATAQQIVISNAPVAPQNVNATLDTGTSVSSTPGSTAGSRPVVKITWDPNPEPDLVGYAVFRYHGGAQESAAFAGCSVGYQTTAPPPCPAKPSVADASSGGGSFGYVVEAMRWGTSWDPAKAVASLPSKPSNQVTVPGAPTTTTTTPAGPTGGAFSVFGPPRTSGGASSSFGSPSFSGTGTGTTVDRGYSPDLPFAGEGEAGGNQAQGSDGPVVKTPLSSHGKNSVGRLALGATALLLLVLAMGGLWLRQQVKHAAVLEPLEPEN